MFDRLIHPKAHLYLHLVGLILIAIGLPLNKVVLSIGTIWVISNWLLEFNFQEKWERLKSNKLLWFIIALYVFHIISLAWSSDIDYGLKDLNSKLPFLVIPFVLGTKKSLPFNHIKIILNFFIFSLILTSLINIIHFYGSAYKLNYREMSLFGSHIRYGILIVFGAFITLHLFFKEEKKIKYVYIFIFLWLFSYTLMSSVFTAFILLGVCLITSLIYLLSFSKLWIKLLAVFGFILGSSIVFVQAKSVYDDVQPKQDYAIENLPKFTKSGNPYKHSLQIEQYERGYHVFAYLNEKELSLAWNKRSELKYYDSVPETHNFGYRMMKYISSKGLTKDKEGVLQLSESDIKNIEKGINSTVELENPFKRKLYKLHEEYQLNKILKNANGSSFFQRIEHSKAALSLLKKNYLFGVGAGDIQNEFNNYYRETNSLLEKENQHRAHNQFFSVVIALGFLGGVFLLIFSFFPFFNLNANWKFIHLIFSVITVVSFLLSDTLETQVGVTFIAFFYALFNFALPKENIQIT